MSFTLVIHGKPQGKDRPRFVRATGRVYTPKETLAAEERILDAWREAGEPVLSGPITVNIGVTRVRPKGHFTSKGLLSAEGKRHLLPDNQKPDLDNVVKLCLDALNKHAFKDDTQVCQLIAHDLWSVSPPDMGYEGSTVINVKEYK